MKNEKIKEYAFIILVWGWLPAGLLVESNYTPKAYDILVILWAFCVIACFLYSVIKDSFVLLQIGKRNTRWTGYQQSVTLTIVAY